MKCSAADFTSVLSKIAAYGSSKIETNNILLHRRPADNRLVLGIASRSTFLTVVSPFTIEKGDPFFIDTISVSEKTINSIVSGMGKYEVEIKLNAENKGFIALTTTKEKYDLAYQIPSQEDVTRVFKSDPTDEPYIFKDVPVGTVKHISTVIGNIATLCADNQFRSIIHRKGKELKCIFLTGTTLNIVELNLPDNEVYDAKVHHGIDTNTNFLPRAMGQILNYMKTDQAITMQYGHGSVYFSTTDMLMRTSFESKGESMEKSISMYHNLKAIIENTQANVLTMHIPGKELEDMINKAAYVLNKSAVTRLDSYIPLYIRSASEVHIAAKSTAGSYTSSLKEQVTIEGLPKNYKEDTAIYNLNVPMSRAMLNTINKTYSGRITIQLRDALENKTYVCIRNEKDAGIQYHIRLRR